MLVDLSTGELHAKPRDYLSRMPDNGAFTRARRLLKFD